MANFIKAALDKVLTYQTPLAIVKYMEMQSALGNPPWKKGGGGKVINILYICIAFCRKHYPAKGI